MAQGEFVCGDTVRDGNGNAYATVQIGALCWTTSNMRAVSYADGTPIAKAMIYNSERYNDTVANLANFGRLYTWFSAVNVPEGDDVKPAKDTAGFVRGVCPEGWHIPTVAEMQDLRSVPEEDLHSTDFWVLPNANTNSTGFSEVPGGKFSAELDRFEGLYTNSYMWTDSATSSEWVVACNSRYFCDKASEESIRKHDALSVRCVFAMEICPLVTTLAADECDIIDTTAVLKGSATDLEGTLQEYGIVWGLTKNALTNTQLSTSITNGKFEAKIAGLPACGDTVYYAAFVKQSSCSETVYGDTMMFVVCGRGQDAKPCLFTPTVTDHENNVYNTVQIGTQCWMKENMRCKTSPKGKLLAGDTNRVPNYYWADTTTTHPGYDKFVTPYYYDNIHSVIPFEIRGLLYNWVGALDTVLLSPTEASFENRRGICPEGWHIPSAKEWEILEDYVSEKWMCADTDMYIAKALAANDYWDINPYLGSDANECMPYFEMSSNNASGFSAIPGGLFYPPTAMPSSCFGHTDMNGYFWTASSEFGTFDKGAAHYLTISYGSENLWSNYGKYKNVGKSVRCVQNNDCNKDCPMETFTHKATFTPDSVILEGRTKYVPGVVSDYGFIWGIDKNMLVNEVNSTTGASHNKRQSSRAYYFNTSIKGLVLTPCDTIWYVAFAKSSECEDYTYGDTLFFVNSSQSCPGTPTVRDHEGNVYNTVKIGNQCWTRENMRARTSPKSLMKIWSHNNHPESAYTPYCFDLDSLSVSSYTWLREIPKKEYGLLYNWPAAMDTTFTSAEAMNNVSFTNRRGICPEGWHVPTKGEFEEMINYVNSVECYRCNGGELSIAKSMAAQNYWRESTNECVPGNDMYANNATGFSAIPAAYVPNSYYIGQVDGAHFWTSTNSVDNPFSNGIHGAFDFWLLGFRDYWLNARNSKSNGISVRCLKDSDCPEVSTIAPDECNVSDTAATLKGKATRLKGETEDHGFVWGTSKNNMTNTLNGTDVDTIASDGTFAGRITNMPPCGDTLYYMTYVKQSLCSETVYGDTMMFIVCGRGQDAKPCLFTPTVTDHEGNVYNTVQIGTQCWMKENMRVRTLPSGRDLTNGGTDTSSYVPYFYDDTASTNTIPLKDRGYYYNWAAALDTTFTTMENVTFHNRRGICPEGWHIPSSLEFTILAGHVESKPAYFCNNDSANVGKSMSSAQYWISHNPGDWSEGTGGSRIEECAPSVNQETNNSTGFSGVPSGYLTYPYGGAPAPKIIHVGNYAMFWLSSESYSKSNAAEWMLHHAYGSLLYGGSHKSNGNPVRCIKDECFYPADSCPTVTTLGAIDTLDGKIRLKGSIDGIMSLTSSEGFVYGSAKDDMSKTVRNYMYNFDKNSIWAVVDDISICDTIWYAAFAKSITCDEYVYGDTLFFVAKPAPQDCGKVYDHEGNEYNTVKLGNQCWTKENMRCRTSPKRYLKPATASSNSDTVFYYALYSNNDTSSIPFVDRGILYNWPGALDTTATDFIEGSFVNRRGICPEGWHIPSKDEWETMLQFVKDNLSDCYDCGENGKGLAKALSSQKYWEEYDRNCTPGNNPKDNNESGFSAVPSGGANDIKFFFSHQSALFWTSTSSHEDSTYSDGKHLAYQCAVTFDTSLVYHGYHDLKWGGRSVRCVKDEQCIGVATAVVDSTVTSTSVTVGGKIYDADMSKVSSFGVYYGDNPDPINNGYKAEAMDIDAGGNFWIPLQDLLYCRDNPLYVVAFAESSNCAQPVYGQVFEVILKAQVEHCGTVTDVDGNVYNTVKLGSQCWMQENLRVTRYQNDDGTPGDEIQLFVTGEITVNAPNADVLKGRIMNYADSSLVEKYGYLYTWNAMMNDAPASNDNPSGVRGICPVGWHAPSNKEWNQLHDYVKSQYLQYGCNCDSNFLGKSFVSPNIRSNENECYVGYNTKTNNATGFTALPVDVYHDGNTPQNPENGYGVWFWSTRDYEYSDNDIRGWCFYTMSSNSNMRYSVWTKGVGISVRCLRDETISTTPKVTTSSVYNVSPTSADCGGNISFDGGAEVVERGLCYSMSKNPTIDDSKIVLGSGVGDFSTTLSGLSSGTLYYIRAYATNSEGTAYGENVMVMPGNRDSQPCEGTPTMQDADSNVYNTVQIGDQCWMRENLRATKYSDGESIAISDSLLSDLVAYRYNPGGDASNVGEYGYLYNWAAVLHGEEASNTNPNPVQGLCPAGWHVPTNDEFEKLFTYVSSQEVWNCDGRKSYIAKHLAASSTSWKSSGVRGECQIGYDYTQNNATNFSLLPAGTIFSNHSGYNLGTYTYLWTSTYSTNIITTDKDPVVCILSTYYSNVRIQRGSNIYALSVRCLKDN